MAGKAKQPLDPAFTPLDSPCNLFFLRRAARATSRLYNAALKSSGLQAPQFSVLFILHSSGAMSITELAKRMGLDRTSMSRNLLPLQQQTLVSVGDEGWHRTRDVSITPSGTKVLKKVLPLWRKAQTDFMAHMGEADTAALIKLLDRVARVE